MCNFHQYYVLFAAHEYLRSLTSQRYRIFNAHIFKIMKTSFDNVILTKFPTEQRTKNFYIQLDLKFIEKHSAPETRALLLHFPEK